jgi:protein gp37
VNRERKVLNMAKSNIEWTDVVWNSITGCTPVSEGCRNCYAAKFAKRLAGRYGYPEVEPFRVTSHPDKLDEPLKWRKPRRVFVNSMGDLFHDDVDSEFLVKVFDVMVKAEQHTFLILTKRPERMRFLFQKNGPLISNEPVPNIWLGVSAENQATADERIPLLLQTPAAVRFVSCEPLLGKINLMDIPFDKFTRMNTLEGCGITLRPGIRGQSIPNCYCNKLDWVITGGETGVGARTCDPMWVRNLRNQCQEAKVPFWFKKWGNGGSNLLDGREWTESPK